MNYESYGKLRIRTYTAGEALPVDAAQIKIYGTDEYNKNVAYSLLTDYDGITAEIDLPAPLRSYSVAPGAKESPYAVYNVEIAKNGFYPKRIDSVPLFAGTAAMLPIEMIPLSYAENGDIIPNDSLNSTIYENENL